MFVVLKVVKLKIRLLEVKRTELRITVEKGFPSNQNRTKTTQSASEATCSKLETYWTRLGLRVDIFHRVSASGSSF